MQEHFHTGQSAVLGISILFWRNFAVIQRPMPQNRHVSEIETMQRNWRDWVNSNTPLTIVMLSKWQ